MQHRWGWALGALAGNSGGEFGPLVLVEERERCCNPNTTSCWYCTGPFALSDTVNQPAPRFAYALVGAVLIFGVGCQAVMREAEESS